MAKIEELDGKAGDISGIEYCVNLKFLRLNVEGEPSRDMHEKQL